MENFKAGDKVAIMTKEGWFVFRNRNSMDFELSEYGFGYLISDFEDTCFLICKLNGSEYDREFIAIHLKDVAQINALPPEQRFEAAKKLYQS